MKTLLIIFSLCVAAFPARTRLDTVYVKQVIDTLRMSGKVIYFSGTGRLDTTGVEYDTAAHKLKGAIDSSSHALVSDTAKRIGVESFPNYTMFYKKTDGTIAPCSLKTNGLSFTFNYATGLQFKGATTGTASIQLTNTSNLASEGSFIFTNDSAKYGSTRKARFAYWVPRGSGNHSVLSLCTQDTTISSVTQYKYHLSIPCSTGQVLLNDTNIASGERRAWLPVWIKNVDPTDSCGLRISGTVKIKAPVSSASDSMLVLQADSSIEIMQRSTSFTNVIPKTDNTYYIGKNDDDTPAAFKGVVLKDQTDGKYYRIELNNGAISIVDLSD